MALALVAMELEFSSKCSVGIFTKSMSSTKLNLSKDELRSKFYKLHSFEDLALLLDVPKSKLYYYAFKADLRKHYKSFEIPKKNGGTRKIFAPSSPLKIVQHKLNQVFQAVYLPKASVHGFVEKRSILSNANRHVQRGKKFIFNADIKDFFPTITAYRISHLLMAKPYNVPEKLAAAITNLCCFDGLLPQGAPTSPVLSNMICAKMDTQLRKLAQNSKCIYTRYADDITFSTTLRAFPSHIATTDETTKALIAGESFERIVNLNGFSLNHKKIRLQSKHNRQEVTGLTVNVFPNVKRKYVRQIRAMLHALEKFEIEKSQNEFLSKYSNGRKVSFLKVLRGKIEFLRMVKGANDLNYLNFSKKLQILDPSYILKIPKETTFPVTKIYITTEGKSDWKHLKASLKYLQSNGEYNDLSIEFKEFGDETPMGDSLLLRRTNGLVTEKYDRININIFDRDNKLIIHDITEDNGNRYKKWTDRLYSFAIPVPSIRSESDVCIELYYSDKDITRKDKNGKRLFLSSEFNKQSHRHNTEDLNCTDRNKFKNDKLTIVDNDVYNNKSEDVALSKNAFADYILNSDNNFQDVDFSEFRLVFNVIRQIIIENVINKTASTP